MEQKRLYRSRKDRMVGGVCAGLAEYFHTDSTVIRLLFALGTLLHGIGLIVYLVLWLVTPEAPLVESSVLPVPAPPAEKDAEQEQGAR
jgi:phage shock protein C